LLVGGEVGARSSGVGAAGRLEIVF
jgi:hypothetical protein